MKGQCWQKELFCSCYFSSLESGMLIEIEKVLLKQFMLVIQKRLFVLQRQIVRDIKHGKHPIEIKQKQAILLIQKLG